MKRSSVLDHQSVNKDRKRIRGLLLFMRTLGQLGFGLIKMFVFLLVLGGLSLAYVSVYEFLSTSPYFRLQNIVVTGVNDDLREELIKISGIKERESILSIDPATVKRNIEGHPWIKSVFLKKEFPHTLYIKAESEEAMAIVLLEQMYLMNRDGVIFKKAERDDRIDFPVVTGLSNGDKRNGECLKKVASFLNILVLGDTPLSLKELSEVHVEENGAFTVYFNKLPFKIFFGEDDFSRKIASLRHIIKHLRATHRFYQARSIDLYYTDMAIVAFTSKVV
jgi:cell division protein FtsQ